MSIITPRWDDHDADVQGDPEENLPVQSQAVPPGDAHTENIIRPTEPIRCGEDPKSVDSGSRSSSIFQRMFTRSSARDGGSFEPHENSSASSRDEASILTHRSISEIHPDSLSLDLRDHRVKRIPESYIEVENGKRSLCLDEVPESTLLNAQNTGICSLSQISSLPEVEYPHNEPPRSNAPSQIHSKNSCRNSVQRSESRADSASQANTIETDVPIATWIPQANDDPSKPSNPHQAPVGLTLNDQDSDVPAVAQSNSFSEPLGSSASNAAPAVQHLHDPIEPTSMPEFTAPANGSNATETESKMSSVPRVASEDMCEALQTSMLPCSTPSLVKADAGMGNAAEEAVGPSRTVQDIYYPSGTLHPTGDDARREDPDLSLRHLEDMDSNETCTLSKQAHLSVDGVSGCEEEPEKLPQGGEDPSRASSNSRPVKAPADPALDASSVVQSENMRDKDGADPIRPRMYVPSLVAFDNFPVLRRHTQRLIELLKIHEPTIRFSSRSRNADFEVLCSLFYRHFRIVDLTAILLLLISDDLKFKKGTESEFFVKIFKFLHFSLTSIGTECSVEILEYVMLFALNSTVKYDSPEVDIARLEFILAIEPLIYETGAVHSIAGSVILMLHKIATNPANAHISLLCASFASRLIITAVYRGIISGGTLSFLSLQKSNATSLYICALIADFDYDHIPSMKLPSDFNSGLEFPEAHTSLDNTDVETIINTNDFLGYLNMCLLLYLNTIARSSAGVGPPVYVSKSRSNLISQIEVATKCIEESLALDVALNAEANEKYGYYVIERFLDDYEMDQPTIYGLRNPDLPSYWTELMPRAMNMFIEERLCRFLLQPFSEFSQASPSVLIPYVTVLLKTFPGRPQIFNTFATRLSSIEDIYALALIISLLNESFDSIASAVIPSAQLVLARIRDSLYDNITTGSIIITPFAQYSITSDGWSSANSQPLKRSDSSSLINAPTQLDLICSLVKFGSNYCENKRLRVADDEMFIATTLFETLQPRFFEFSQRILNHLTTTILADPDTVASVCQVEDVYIFDEYQPSIEMNVICCQLLDIFTLVGGQDREFQTAVLLLMDRYQLVDLQGVDRYCLLRLLLHKGRLLEDEILVDGLSLLYGVSPGDALPSSPMFSNSEVDSNSSSTQFLRKVGRRASFLPATEEHKKAPTLGRTNSQGDTTILRHRYTARSVGLESFESKTDPFRSLLTPDDALFDRLLNAFMHRLHGFVRFCNVTGIVGFNLMYNELRLSSTRDESDIYNLLEVIERLKHDEYVSTVYASIYPNCDPLSLFLSQSLLDITGLVDDYLRFAAWHIRNDDSSVEFVVSTLGYLPAYHFIQEIEPTPEFLYSVLSLCEMFMRSGRNTALCGFAFLLHWLASRLDSNDMLCIKLCTMIYGLVPVNSTPNSRFEVMKVGPYEYERRSFGVPGFTYYASDATDAVNELRILREPLVAFCKSEHPSIAVTALKTYVSLPDRSEEDFNAIVDNLFSVLMSTKDILKYDEALLLLINQHCEYPAILHLMYGKLMAIDDVNAVKYVIIIANLTRNVTYLQPFFKIYPQRYVFDIISEYLCTLAGPLLLLYAPVLLFGRQGNPEPTASLHPKTLLSSLDLLNDKTFDQPWDVNEQAVIAAAHENGLIGTAGARLLRQLLRSTITEEIKRETPRIYDTLAAGLLSLDQRDDVCGVVALSLAYKLAPSPAGFQSLILQCFGYTTPALGVLNAQLATYAHMIARTEPDITVSEKLFTCLMSARAKSYSLFLPVIAFDLIVRHGMWHFVEVLNPGNNYRRSMTSFYLCEALLKRLEDEGDPALPPKPDNKPLVLSKLQILLVQSAECILEQTIQSAGAPTKLWIWKSKSGLPKPPSAAIQIKSILETRNLTSSLSATSVTYLKTL